MNNKIYGMKKITASINWVKEIPERVSDLVVGLFYMIVLFTLLLKSK